MTIRLGVFLILAFSLLATTVHAGESYNPAVAVGSTYAYGEINAAATSNNTTEKIGCFANTSYGWCEATTAAGAKASCWTTDPDLMTIIRQIPESFGVISFHFTTNWGTCSALSMSRGSTAN